MNNLAVCLVKHVIRMLSCHFIYDLVKHVIQMLSCHFIYDLHK